MKSTVLGSETALKRFVRSAYAAPVIGKDEATERHELSEQVFAAIPKPTQYPCIAVRFADNFEYIYFDDFKFTPWGIMKAEM